MDSGLAVAETTNNIPNTTLFELYVQPQSLFVWQRARIANALSSTGPQWISYFSEYNSGTYNNQWIILNYNLFEPNKALKDNLLWIAEQLPGNMTSEDVTQTLERGHWPSYNVPYNSYTYDVSGNARVAKLFGPSESYDLAPRARIFRRDSNKCNNLTSIQKLMRYNNYKNDEIENNHPGWAIMSRYDLTEGEPS